VIEGGEPYQAVFGIAVVGPPRPASAVHLTKRQNEVLELLGEGASTDQIAATLHLSTETVRNYVRQVLRALGAHSRLEAVGLAYREGLLGGED
jgi:DNA-binding NarL/FixJ family response regulator